jgi:hypothetical protein
VVEDVTVDGIGREHTVVAVWNTSKCSFSPIFSMNNLFVLLYG